MSSRDSFALVFRQEECGAVAFAVEAHNVFVVGFAVNEELVPLARRFVDTIEGINVGLALAATHDDAFATREADIVAPLLLHIRQQRFFVGSDIQYPFVAHMAGVRCGAKAAS